MASAVVGIAGTSAVDAWVRASAGWGAAIQAKERNYDNQSNDEKKRSDGEGAHQSNPFRRG